MHTPSQIVLPVLNIITVMGKCGAPSIVYVQIAAVGRLSLSISGKSSNHP